jgi:thymidylate kinase
MIDSLGSEAQLPRFVVLEGVDGTGKTTFASGLSAYYQAIAPLAPSYVGAFPGSTLGTLGEWVYRFHHGQIAGLMPEHLPMEALQLLHIAAHVDAIKTRIAPVLLGDGYVILDRYWWSIYVYARLALNARQAWGLVDIERPFWEPLPRPVVVYLTRSQSLKRQELNTRRHEQLSTFYKAVIERERRDSVVVHEIHNDGNIEAGWANMLNILGMPFRPMEEEATTSLP